MGHPAQGRGIFVDNAQGFKKWYVLGKLVCFEHNIAESSTFREFARRVN